MHLYVLIQDVQASSPESAGILHWLPGAQILEQYQTGHYRLSLIAVAGSWGPEARLASWFAVVNTNLIAWEKVS